MTTTWEIVDGSPHTTHWDFNFKSRQNGGENEISHTFQQGAFFDSSRSGSRIILFDIALDRPVFFLEPTLKELHYTLDHNYGHTKMKLDDATSHSLESYIRSIDINSQVMGHVNSLQVANYSSADDVLHIANEEDPVPRSRNEDEPYNISVGDPIRGGYHQPSHLSKIRGGRRRSTRKNRRRHRKHVR